MGHAVRQDLHATLGVGEDLDDRPGPEQLLGRAV
jgi:hypothetical protein